MKSRKKITIILFLFTMFLNSSLFADSALIWGYFTDTSQNFITGIVDATSTGYSDTTPAGNGYYMIYVPTGTYTLTATSNGYETQQTVIHVEMNGTYQVDFRMVPLVQAPAPQYLSDIFSFNKERIVLNSPNDKARREEEYELSPSLVAA